MDTLAMLEELLEQDQFELLIPKDGMSGELRLVYLMNDSVPIPCPTRSCTIP